MKSLVVEGFEVIDEGLAIDVKPRWLRVRCGGCGRRCSQYDRRAARRWRHLDFGGVQIWLRYAPRRGNCPGCGVRVEQLPWTCWSRSRYTTAFEDAVAFLTQRCDKSSVEQTMRMSWRSVGAVVERVVGRRHGEDRLAGLRHIGIDELSYRKGHRYITLVVDQDTGMPVWAADGKNAETLGAFFDELGPERCQLIKAVSIDMSQAYIKAVRSKVPHAQIVFDRFHVQKLVNEAVDETRREEWRRLRELDKDQAKSVKGLRWPLLKNTWNLTPAQSERLSTLQRDNKRLYRAYLLKQSFAAILDRRQPNVVTRMLQDWCGWAARSRLPAFVKVARTIRKHLDDIVAYIRWRLTNGLVEGINGKARVLTRRAYGFHSPQALIAMIMLCCTNIWIAPPRVRLAK